MGVDDATWLKHINELTYADVQRVLHDHVHFDGIATAWSQPLSTLR